MMITAATMKDELEADARREIAKVAGMQVRGWDSQRERERRLAEVDLALDRYLAAQ